jgi:IMP dehydrogenase/GMP reductase
MKFDFNDIVIEPKYLSSISSRKEIDVNVDGRLPIFVSPMDTVVDKDNYDVFLKLGMNVCLPRKTGFIFNKNEMYVSYGLDEIIDTITHHENNRHTPEYWYKYGEEQSVLYKYEHKKQAILIDIANGHMDKLYDAIKRYKKIFPYTTLMVGNVANPHTFRMLSEAGADYIRVGIGNGAGCLTTQQTGVGYPMASLIQECYRMKISSNLKAKIVADGGFKSYSDIIKALALGADYVMLGSILNKSLESSGDMYWKGIKLNRRLANFLYKRNFKIKKKFRGMSTKEVQKKWGNTSLKTSEGVTRFFDVEYTLEQWTKNFIDYLKSAMSYTDCRDLTAFIGKVNFNMITNESYKRFNK